MFGIWAKEDLIGGLKRAKKYLLSMCGALYNDSIWHVKRIKAVLRGTYCQDIWYLAYLADESGLKEDLLSKYGAL